MLPITWHSGTQRLERLDQLGAEGSALPRLPGNLLDDEADIAHALRPAPLRGRGEGVRT